MAWHKHAYYACTMTGVASSATGLTRYYQKAGIDATVVCHTGDGCARTSASRPSAAPPSATRR